MVDSFVKMTVVLLEALPLRMALGLPRFLSSKIPICLAKILEHFQKSPRQQFRIPI